MNTSARKPVTACEMVEIIRILLRLYYAQDGITYDSKVDNNGALHDNKGRFAKKNGTFIPCPRESEAEIQTKINCLNKIDWNKRQHYILSNFNSDVVEYLGLQKNKKILLKDNIIFDKNNKEHSDVTPEQAVRILGGALYKPENILKASLDNADYHNFITTIRDNKYGIALVELSETKEYYEIVNWHFMGKGGLKQKIKRDEKIKNY